MKSKLLLGSIVLVVGVAIVGVREYVGIANSSGDEIKNKKVVEVPKKSTEPVTKVYDKEVSAWISAMVTILSEPWTTRN